MSRRMEGASGLRSRVHELLAEAQAGDDASQAVDFGLLALIALNVLAFVLETVPEIGQRHAAAFAAFETLSVGLFTLEYALRLWACAADPAFQGPLMGRLRYGVRPLLLVDLLAILPFWLPFLGIDLRAFRVLRFLRLARVLKLARYSEAMQTLSRALTARKEELVSTLGGLLLVLLLASSLMYFAEREAQPEVFTSVPAATWWAMATLTTVGYGDVTPVTPLGKLLASVIAVIGIAVFALPTAILGSAFASEWRHARGEEKRCPHCGSALGS